MSGTLWIHPDPFPKAKVQRERLPLIFTNHYKIQSPEKVISLSIKMAPRASTEYSIEEDEGVTKVIDFAIQKRNGDGVQLERRRSLKRMGMLVWNPRARNLRRGFLRRWIEGC